jgi:hypothetical protein
MRASKSSKIEPATTAAGLTLAARPKDSGARRFDLALHRLLLALLIATGVALAPVGAAMAALTQAQAAEMADTPDCPNTAKQPAKDCACCDAKAPCQADLCLAKCFKLNGELAGSTRAQHWVKPVFTAAVPARPPDGWPEPDAPPPRA